MKETICTERDIRELEQITGHDFRCFELLVRSMRHSSYVNEHGMMRENCNERLEFLGDAVLELVSSQFLYEQYPEKPEGDLTRLRASLVCEPALAFSAKAIGLPSFLLLGKGEEATGGRGRDSIVSDALEAVIGALYLDGGLEIARAFILKYILDDVEHKQLFYDSKTRLQEEIQKTPGNVISYEIPGTIGPDHDRRFRAVVKLNGEIIGEGEGRTKKAAEQQAAYQALVDRMTKEHSCI